MYDRTIVFGVLDLPPPVRRRVGAKYNSRYTRGETNT